MRHIRRATVTGLFALWLAPLSASAEAPATAGLRNDRTVQAEQRLSAGQRDEDEEPDQRALARTTGKD